MKNGTSSGKPIDTCETCRQVYWACACGDSPIGGIFCDTANMPPRPERCGNMLHTDSPEVPMNIRLVDSRHCCKSCAHHAGSTCRHCGKKD